MLGRLEGRLGPGGRLCFGWIVDLDPRGTVPLVVHGLELSVARILAEAVEGHMTKSTVGGDAVLVGFIFPWHFPVDLSVFAALEVSCRELLEFGVAYVVEDAAVNDLCAWSACSKDRRRLAHSAPARGGKQDDCFACQVVRLEECVDNRRCHVPPDGKSQKDGVVVFDALDPGGYGGTAGGIGFVCRASRGRRLCMGWRVQWRTGRCPLHEPGDMQRSSWCPLR